MGTSTPSWHGSGIGDALFSSTQQRALALLFGQPHRSYYTNEIIALMGAGTGAAQRELSKLSKSGLVTVEQIGNQKHYQANRHSPIFSELKAIVEKTFGLASVLSSVLIPLQDRIQTAFVFGSIAKGNDRVTSDIDMLIISDSLPYGELFIALAKSEAILGRPVNPTIYSPTEFMERRRKDSSFLTRVLKAPKIWLIGGEDALAT